MLIFPWRLAKHGFQALHGSAQVTLLILISSYPHPTGPLRTDNTVLGYLLNKLNMFMTVCFRTDWSLCSYLGISLPSWSWRSLCPEKYSSSINAPCYLKLSRMMSLSYLYPSHDIHISTAIFFMFHYLSVKGEHCVLII